MGAESIAVPRTGFRFVFVVPNESCLGRQRCPVSVNRNALKTHSLGCDISATAYFEVMLRQPLPQSLCLADVYQNAVEKQLIYPLLIGWNRIHVVDGECARFKV